MASVTVIGLGPMGSAIASKLVDGGHQVTVWNRTASKAEPLLARGVVLADSVADAIAASPIVLFSLAGYHVAKELTDSPEAEQAASGHILVNLSAGSARQAQEMAAWADEQGARFLSGSVMGYPRGLGEPGMAFILSGDPATFAECEEVIRTLAPAARLAAEVPGGSSTVASALWNFYYGAYGAFLETAALADAAGAGIGDFAGMATAFLDVVRDGIEDTAERVQKGDLGGEQASIDGIARDLAGGRRVFEKHGVEPRFTSAFLADLAQAQEAGDGDKDPAAAFLHLRAGD